MSCQYCGAPIERSTESSTTCGFCGRVNDPLPRFVEVPVPVQIVNVVQTAPDTASVRELRCPRCRKRLVTAKVKDVDLHGCAGCGGIWIENASARGVLANPEPIFGEMAKRAGDYATNRATHAGDRTCPQCPALLDRVTSHGIELDVCSDHGTWFDAYELGMLVRILRGEETAKPMNEPVRTIQCAHCHAEIIAERANITDMGLQCDACWRGEQNAEIASFDEKIRDQSSVVAVGGVLLGLAAAMISAESR